VYLNATLLAQICVFIILALFTMRFIWPPIVRALDERAARISEGLADAERGRENLAVSSRQAAETVRGGREKATELIAQAEKRAGEIIERAKADARQEAGKLVLEAKEEIEREEARMRDSLRGRVAELAVAGAEKILRREVDAKAHAEMLASLGQDL
jgi:F-type H+-transporting ATPase subunit b